MTRSKGSRNADYAERRAELVARARERLAQADAPYPSLRELAEACGSRETTLRHYFGKREDLIEAIFADHLEAGKPYLAIAAKPSGPFEQSVRDAVTFMMLGHSDPVAKSLSMIGIAEGLRSSRLGPVFLRHGLDPGVDALAARLARHIEAGEMRPCDPRVAALMLASPLMIAYLHQADLGGASASPIDMRAFVDELVRNFVAAYANG